VLIKQLHLHIEILLRQTQLFVSCHQLKIFVINIEHGKSQWALNLLTRIFFPLFSFALFALYMPIQSLNENRNLKNRVGVNVGCVAGGF
jgi:hypothetical protein